MFSYIRNNSSLFFNERKANTAFDNQEEREREKYVNLSALKIPEAQ